MPELTSGGSRFCLGKSSRSSTLVRINNVKPHDPPFPVLIHTSGIRTVIRHTDIRQDPRDQYGQCVFVRMMLRTEWVRVGERKLIFAKDLFSLINIPRKSIRRGERTVRLRSYGLMYRQKSFQLLKVELARGGGSESCALWSSPHSRGNELIDRWYLSKMIDRRMYSGVRVSRALCLYHGAGLFSLTQ
jgi:hypothetical protein